MNSYQSPRKYTVTVSKIVALSSTVKLFRFQFNKDIIFSFIPGQFVIIYHTQDGNEVKRSYSIASAPANSDYIEILVKRKNNGKMTPWLHNISEGTKLDIHGPFGRFNIRNKEKELIFIAAGAGIAPFRSIVTDYLKNNKGHITVIFGFRSEKDFFFRDEFEKLAISYKNFTFIPTASQPSAAWKGTTGRVTAILKDCLKPDDNYEVYLCGPPAMVQDTIEALTELGFKKEQVYFEQWG